MTLDITILMVAGPDDEPYIRENIDLIKRTNKEYTPTIFVIDNGKTSPRKNGITGTLDAIVLDGTAQNSALLETHRASYQHAAALNYFLQTQRFNTRYLLILDPDFYIIKPDWLIEIMSYMSTQNLAFFGAPWHPKWYSKYRYFPCVHCLFIDTHALNVSALDFTPALKEPKIKWQKRKLSGHSATPTSKEISHTSFSLLRFGAALTIHRRYIAASHDTGHRIYQIYRHSTLHRNSLLKPVMSSTDSPYHLRYSLGRWLESLLPESINFIPKKLDYFSKNGFSEKGSPDINSLGWEEFLWKETPFGFHLRRFNKGERDIPTELANLHQTLESFAR